MNEAKSTMGQERGGLSFEETSPAHIVSLVLCHIATAAIWLEFAIPKNRPDLFEL